MAKSSAPCKRGASRRGRMTRVQFVDFLQTVRFGIAIDGPYDIKPCVCRDINCHGWRLVTRGAA